MFSLLGLLSAATGCAGHTDGGPVTVGVEVPDYAAAMLEGDTSAFHDDGYAYNLRRQSWRVIGWLGSL